MPPLPLQAESNFGNHHRFLLQALMYLASPHRDVKRTAMKFIRTCWPAVLGLATVPAKPPTPHCPGRHVKGRAPVPWGQPQGRQWRGPRSVDGAVPSARC